MSSKKKKRSCPFSSAKARPKKAKSTFNKEWAAKFAESDKGSYYNQEELLDEIDNDCDHDASEQAEISASRAKISLQFQETVEAEEIDEENWTKLKGRSIVSGERLQERLGDAAVSCRFCQGDVDIMENVKSRNGLGSSWIIRCQNEPANVISSSIFVFASTSVVEFPLTTSALAFPFVRFFLGDVLRTFGIFTDMVIILKISQPISKISNSNTVNQKINSRLLTLVFSLHARKSGERFTARCRGKFVPVPC